MSISRFMNTSLTHLAKRKGINRFIANADAVNDAIISRIWPGLERGYASAWMDEFYEDDWEENP